MHARIAAATIPVIVLLWVGVAGYLWQRYSTDLKYAGQDSRNLSHAFEENIRRTIEAIDTTIRAVRIARAQDLVHFDLKTWERDSGLTRDLTLQISVLDRNGNVVATNLNQTPARSISIADRDHFRRPRETPGDTLFISRPVLGRVSGRWSVQFVRKLLDADGSFDGVVVASLDPSFLSRFYSSLDIGHGALMLLGQDGVVRSAAPSGLTKLGDDVSATPLMSSVAQNPIGTIRLDAIGDRIDRIYSWRSVAPYGLVVVVGMSTADALVDFWLHVEGYVTVALLLTLLILLITSVLSRHRRDVTQSREMLQAAVENISQGLLVVDAARRVPVLNARAVELLELPPHLAVPGIEFDSLLEFQLQAGEFAGQNDAPVRQLVESGGILGGVSVYRRARRNGTVLEVRTKVLETGMAVRTFTDVTEQELNAQVLAEARDAAEAAVRARSEFLAVMSHEIRTPLNGVIGVAGLLEDMELGQAQREYVQLIRQSGDHLLELINDILDFSRLEAQRMDLEETTFDPAALLHGVVGMFMTQAAGKGLSLTASAQQSVPGAVIGDPGRLRQILLNLVGNAIKFTDQGWIRMTMTHERAGEGRIRLLLSVADSGIGIIPEAIERMFQEFTQMDGSISRRFGGSGLGLAICRRLVEMMGGTIEVDSKPGAGSTFRFDVVLKEARQAPSLTLAQSEVAGSETPLHILLAEDNATNRLVALRILERLGHQAEAVVNGAEAIAALMRTRYDLILMDVMMPEMDGLTATRRIRAGEGGQSHIAIVGLTAGSSAEAHSECLEAGMDAVTTKPVTLPRLQASIRQGRVLGVQRTVTAAPEPATSRLRELAEMLGEAAVEDIIQMFTIDSRKHLASLQNAAAIGDTQTIHRLAHSIVGASRNLGADALAERAANLERLAGTMSASRIEDEVNAMQAELDTVLECLGVEHPAAMTPVGNSAKYSAV